MSKYTAYMAIDHNGKYILIYEDQNNLKCSFQHSISTNDKLEFCIPIKNQLHGTFLYDIKQSGYRPDTIKVNTYGVYLIYYNERTLSNILEIFEVAKKIIEQYSDGKY